MKYFLRKQDYGKYEYYKIESCSSERAKELESEGYKIFDSKEKAREHREKLKKR